MSFSRDLVETIERVCQGWAQRWIAGIHLPPARSDGLPCKKFGVIELDDGSCGFFPTQFERALPRLRRLVDSQSIVGSPAFSVAQTYESSDEALRAVGLGTSNALSQHHLTTKPGALDPDPDPLAGINPVPGEQVGMVGFFRPLLGVLPQQCALTIVEQNPRFLREQGHFEVTLDLGRLKYCDAIFITAATLLNGTLDHVLEHCPTAARVAVIGPTAGCLPEPFFSRGIDAVGSSRVVHREAMRERLLAGQPWREAVAKYCIQRERTQF